MAKPKSCKNCKWLRDDAYFNEYTGKVCFVKFKGKPDWYQGTVHEKKDLTPCDKFERK